MSRMRGRHIRAAGRLGAGAPDVVVTGLRSARTASEDAAFRDGDPRRSEGPQVEADGADGMRRLSPVSPTAPDRRRERPDPRTRWAAGRTRGLSPARPRTPVRRAVRGSRSTSSSVTSCISGPSPPRARSTRDREKPAARRVRRQRDRVMPVASSPGSAAGVTTASTERGAASYGGPEGLQRLSKPRTAGLAVSSTSSTTTSGRVRRRRRSALTPSLNETFWGGDDDERRRGARVGFQTPRLWVRDSGSTVCALDAVARDLSTDAPSTSSPRWRRARARVRSTRARSSSPRAGVNDQEVRSGERGRSRRAWADHSTTRCACC